MVPIMTVAQLLDDAREQEHTAGVTALACGDVVIVDAATAGVVKTLQGIPANGTGAVALRGRFRVTAKPTAVIVKGDQLIYSLSNAYASNKTADAGASSVSLGRAAKAKANGETTVDVFINEPGVNNLT